MENPPLIEQEAYQLTSCHSAKLVLEIDTRPDTKRSGMIRDETRSAGKLRPDRACIRQVGSLIEQIVRIERDGDVVEEEV